MISITAANATTVTLHRATEADLTAALLRRVTYTKRTVTGFTSQRIFLDGEHVGTIFGSKSKGWEVKDYAGTVLVEIAPTRKWNTPDEMEYELRDLLWLLVSDWI